MAVARTPDRKPWTKGDDHGRLRGRALQRVRRSVLMGEPMCRKCAKAGLIVVAVEVDHITPLSKGGTYDRDNLQPLCTPCHEAKTAAEQGRRPRPPGVDASGWPLDR